MVTVILFFFADMYTLLKKYLFSKDPEWTHYWVMNRLKSFHSFGFGRGIIKSWFGYSDSRLAKNVFGLSFKNPIGLAAGFDKDAKYIDELAALGFGCIEIGTLTPKPQDGNDKPRLFRLIEDEAIINRMGFNNEGVDAAVERLKKRKSTVIVGGNIGKNKVTPNEKAVEDYEYCFRKLYDWVDYFVVNVSSPNTPNLRALQEKEPLKQLLGRLQEVNKELGKNRPLLLKIAPDLSHEQLDDIIEIANETQLAGIVATNTTIERTGLLTSSEKIEAIGAGGLSGAPLSKRSTAIIRYLKSKNNNQWKIIAVGGIATTADAKEKLEAGADLLQVYTGFIYKGPDIVKQICSGL